MSIKLMNNFDSFIRSGRVYQIDDIITLTAGQTISFVAEVTEDTEIFVLPISVLSEKAKLRLNIYEDTDYTGTIALNVFNLNRERNRQTTLEVRGNVTGTTKGNVIRKHLVLGQAGQGNANDVLGVGVTNALVLNRNKKYLVELQNVDIVDTEVEYTATWVEGEGI
jgi:hypothetical protein